MLLTLLVLVLLFLLAGGGTLLVLNQTVANKDGGSTTPVAQAGKEKQSGDKRPTELGPPKSNGGDGPAKPPGPGGGTTPQPDKKGADGGGEEIPPLSLPAEPPGGKPSLPPDGPKDPVKVDLPKGPGEKDPKGIDPVKDTDPPLDKVNPKEQDGRLQVLDDFGNPLSKDVGLSLNDEFKGKKILIWAGAPRDLFVQFPAHNPLWKALKEKGFEIAFAHGAFPQNMLAVADQVWIVSCGKEALNHKMTSVNELPPFPPGTNVGNNPILADMLECLKYPPTRATLTPGDLQALQTHLSKGKGLLLMADNDPFTLDANVVGNHLFGTNISGNYEATKIAYVLERKLTPDQIQKYTGGKSFGVHDHPLLTGVNFMYEGITVSHFTESPKLEVVMRASDNQPLIGVSKVAGQRVVIDCGYTRYTFGPHPDAQFVNKTAGTIRFAENLAAYLMGKGKQ